MLLLSACGCTNPLSVRNADCGVEHAGARVAALSESVSIELLAGDYRYSDGFWSWELHLQPNGKYAYCSITDNLEVAEDGSMQHQVDSVAQGTWSLGSPRELKLVSEEAETVVWTILRVEGKLGLMVPARARDLRRVYTRIGEPVAVSLSGGRTEPVSTTQPR